MKILFSPSRSDTPLRLVRQGDVLCVNGTDYDFSAVPEGALLPRDAVSGDWLAGDVTRQNGVLQVPVLLPVSANSSDAARFPAPLTLSDDGLVPLPGADIQT